MTQPQHLLILSLLLTMSVAITSCTDDVSKFTDDTETDTAADSAVDSDSDTVDIADSDTQDSADSETATGSSANDSETAVDTETATSDDTGEDSETAVDSGTETTEDTADTSIDTETETETADTGTASDTDAVVEGLKIEAECAIKNDLAVCGANAPAGSCSAVEDTLNWISDPERDPQTYPTFTSDQQLGYTAGGSWFAFEGINLDQYTTVTMRYASQEDAEATITTGFRMHIDTVDGTEPGFIETNHTGSWQTYEEVEITLDASVSGTHTVFFVAETNDINNGNVDWIHFKN